MKQNFWVKCKSEKNGALTPSNLPQQWDGGEKGEKYFAPRRTFLAKIGEKTTEFHLCRPLLISAVTRWMRYFDRRRTFLAKIGEKTTEIHLCHPPLISAVTRRMKYFEARTGKNRKISCSVLPDAGQMIGTVWVASVLIWFGRTKGKWREKRILIARQKTKGHNHNSRGFSKVETALWSWIMY